MNERLIAIREWLKKHAPKIGFPLFYLFCLIVFASWTLPYDRLKERIIVSFNAGQRAAGSTQELQIDDLGSSWITGVKAKGVRLVTPSSEPNKQPTETDIDSAVVRISLLGLLVGNRDLSYSVDAFGGTVRGSYDDRGKSQSLQMEVEGVDVGKVGPLKELLGVPLEGALTGTIQLDIEPAKVDTGKAPSLPGLQPPPKASGAVALEVADLAIGDGKAKLKGALALPRMNVGALSIAGEAKDGVFTVKKLGAGGKDLELSGDGRIQIKESLLESLADLNIKFKINDTYRAKNDITKSLFGAPGSSAPALFELADPKIKQSKRADGYYAWRLRGPLAHLEPIPAGGPGLAPSLPTFNNPLTTPTPFAAPSAFGGAPRQ